MAFGGFFAAYGFAFYWGWLYSCILLVILPFAGLAGFAMGYAMQSGKIEEMRAYAQSAGYAEQALQAIKVVHTYGCEKLELKNYITNLDETR